MLRSVLRGQVMCWYLGLQVCPAVVALRLEEGTPGRPTTDYRAAQPEASAIIQLEAAVCLTACHLLLQQLLLLFA